MVALVDTRVQLAKNLNKGPLASSITLQSSFSGGLDTFDSTNRIILESYQRPAAGPYGEGIRFNLKHPQAKIMQAWYFPTDLESIWNASTNPMRATPTVWWGAHYKAQDDGDGIHSHISVECPDQTTGNPLQTRFSVDWGSWDNNNVWSYGGNRIAIYTNLADFTVNANSGDPTDPNVSRISGSSSYDALLEFSNSTIGRGSERVSGRRWQFGKAKNAESAGNNGSDLVLRAFDNSGGAAGTAMLVKRSSLNFGFGVANDSTGTYTLGRVSARYAGGATHGLYVVPSAAGSGSGSMVFGNAFAVSDRLVSGQVQGDTSQRYVQYADGKQEWGDGTAARDTNLYRGGADTVQTDDNLTVGMALRINGAAGLGFVQHTLQTSTPATPAAGKVREFYRTNGSNKIERCVVYPSGVVQVLSTEP
jgi:hypothetical protein